MSLTSLQQQFGRLPWAGRAGGLVMLLGLMAALYYAFGHAAITAELAATQTENRQLQDSLGQAQRRRQDYLKLREMVAARQAVERGYLRVLPHDAEIPAFLADLHRLAEMSDLRLDVVQPRPEEAGDFFVKVPVSLQMKGQYHQLAKFFYNISQLERAVSMEDLSLAEPVMEGDDILLKVKVLATTYRKRMTDGDPAPAKGKRG